MPTNEHFEQGKTRVPDPSPWEELGPLTLGPDGCPIPDCGCPCHEI